MKSMKLYDGIDRIHRELAAVGIGAEAPLRVADLTALDQYHYHGTIAVDDAISALGLRHGMRLLDIGAGLGGPARYIAEKTGAHVVALELQEDLSATGKDLTRRCGLSHLVEHVHGNVLDGVDQKFDAIISLLCFLHIPDRERLFKNCRAALRAGGKIFIEDYALGRAINTAEAEALAKKVQCPYLPSTDEYRVHLASAGFSEIIIRDVTEDWTDFTSTRLMAYKSARARNVALHGEELVAGLEDFYETVAGLFVGGAIRGLKISASASL